MRTANIQMENISKIFGKQKALKDISIEVDEGEILGFLGPSGAGKTTTIKILTGQLKQTSGKATLLGEDTLKLTQQIYSEIGIVTDNSGFYEKLSVYDNLVTFCNILDVDKKRIDVLLEQAGLTDAKKKPAGKLSKGMKQRLVLVRALLHKPKVLFLDEPTSGLDPTTTLEIHKMLLHLKKQGTSIFLTTHNMEEASKLCDHVALLNDGNIVEFGTPQNICLKYNQVKTYHVLLEDGQEATLSESEADIEQLATWMKQGKIASLRSSEPTLETVFLEITGRELQ